MNPAPPPAPTSASVQPPVQFLPKNGHPTIYVEGLSQILVGFPNSRMLMHSLAQRDVANPAAPELRQIACELVMPTSALLELAQNIISGLSGSKQQMETIKLEWLSKLEALTNSLPSPPVSGPETQP